MPELTPTDFTQARPAAVVPLRHALPQLIRDPLKALVGFADEARGEVIRLNLGTFRPYLVSSPAHVQHVLRDNAANYVRGGKGILWRPVKRLFGEGVLADGPIWESSRRTLQPLFTAKRLETLVEGMAVAVSEAVDEMEQPARAGQVFDISAELSRIVCHAIMRVLFADRISVPDARRIVEAQDVIATSIFARLLLPFVPNSVPMPGDRPFHRAVTTIDSILLPVLRDARRYPDDGDDVISVLTRAYDDERQIRNDTVAMFATTTESTFGALTFLWPLLQNNPQVATRLYEEIDRVVGPGPISAEQLGELRYLKMILDELLRIYPAGWMIPRTSVGPDVIDGVRVNPGTDVFISPYITQHMTMFWERPEVFDPDRFAPEHGRRHRYLHYPFGGGPHQCLGQYLFYLEAQLIVATILSRFRFQLIDPAIPAAQPAASLRPKTKVEMTLRPLDRFVVS